MNRHYEKKRRILAELRIEYPPNYEYAQRYLRDEMKALKDAAEIKHGKPTRQNLDECVNEAVAILKVDADNSETKIGKLAVIIMRLSPHNPHGGHAARGPLDQLPLFRETASRWLGELECLMSPDPRRAKYAARAFGYPVKEDET